MLLHATQQPISSLSVFTRKRVCFLLGFSYDNNYYVSCVVSWWQSVWTSVESLKNRRRSLKDCFPRDIQHEGISLVFPSVAGARETSDVFTEGKGSSTPEFEWTSRL